jgi:hypothetical protein
MPRGADSNQSLFVCHTCDYTTDREGKLARHFETEKHYIAVYGITCCGLTYHNKHRYVNHKKSEKHRHNLEHNKDIIFQRNKEKINLNLTINSTDTCENPTQVNLTPKTNLNTQTKCLVGEAKTVLDLSPVKA